MKPRTDDIGRSVDDKGNGEARESRPPKWSGPIEKTGLEGQIRSPEGESEGGGSKVTWQGFIDWMTSRGA